MASDTLFREKAPGIMALLMQDFALDEESAAAILGNLGHESGGFRFLQEKEPMIPGSAGGFGWAQWTGPRRRAYEAYCARNDLDPAGDKANYGFLFVELMGSEAKAIPAVRSAVGLENKVEAFELAFERAGIKHYESRNAWAQKALAAYRAGGWESLRLGAPELPRMPPVILPPLAPGQIDLTQILAIALPLLQQVLATRQAPAGAGSGGAPPPDIAAILAQLLAPPKPALPPPPPPAPEPVVVAAKPAAVPTGVQTGLVALLAGVGAQLAGVVAPPVGEASTMAGTLTTFIPVAQMALSYAGVYGKIAAAALPMLASLFAGKGKPQ